MASDIKSKQIFQLKIRYDRLMTMTDLKDFIKIGPNYVRHYTDISTPDKIQKSKSKWKGI